jgi:DNA-binding response OmpR family regulator
VTEEPTAVPQGNSQPGGSPRILIVDADLSNQQAIRPALEQHGYAATFLTGGEGALELVQSGLFDMVFLNLALPDMDGTAISRQVRASEAGGRRIPIIALSDPDFPVQPVELIKAGIDDYIIKPYDMRQIARMLNVYAPNAVHHAPVAEQPAQAGSVGQNELAVLDTAAALEDFSGNIEGYKALLQLLLASLPERLERMESFYQAASWVELAREFHNVKSIAASLGAQQFSDLANRIEQLCKSGETGSLGAMMQEMESSAQALKVRAGAFLESAG